MGSLHWTESCVKTGNKTKRSTNQVLLNVFILVLLGSDYPSFSFFLLFKFHLCSFDHVFFTDLATLSPFAGVFNMLIHKNNILK